MNPGVRKRRIFPGLLFPLVLLCVWGLIIGAPPAEEPRPDCTALVWRAGMDQEGWDMLIEQGYHVQERASGLVLLLPECESENPS